MFHKKANNKIFEWKIKRGGFWKIILRSKPVLEQRKDENKYVYLTEKKEKIMSFEEKNKKNKRDFFRLVFIY